MYVLSILLDVLLGRKSVFKSVLVFENKVCNIVIILWICR